MSRAARGSVVALLSVLLSAPTIAFAATSGGDFTVSPLSGPVGTTVTIDAAGTTVFATTGSATVTFNGVPATTVGLVSTTELTAVVPSTATTGPVTVTSDTTTYSGPTFTVQAPPQPTAATWSATASRTLVHYGNQLTVTGVLTAAGAAVSGATAQLESHVTGSAWQPAARTTSRTTNGLGMVSWVVVPRENTHYRVASAATTDYLAAVSSSVATRVIPQLTVQPLDLAPAYVTSLLSGRVRPSLPGPLRLQLRVGTDWRNVARVSSADGTFSFPIKPTSTGPLRYRVVAASTSRHASATSPVARVRVISGQLRYGSSGADVLALQSRLRELHYDVGPTSSFYGWDMVHAVTAFEKVQGISRDGVAGTSFWQHLGNPRVPHLMHPKPNVPLTVEINLSRQVLILAKHGEVWRIIDTSTGGGYTYTGTSGEPAVAITPTGHFSIRYKVDHLVTDTLGTLWRPSYFNYTGYAIHGEGDTNAGNNVPSYPASHGCVRITDLAANRYYSLLAVGTPVWIYK